MRRLSSILVLLFLGGLAIADEPREEARKHFETGEIYLEAGRYDDAIAEYRAAHALVPSPAFLYNIAQAYRRKGDAASAIAHYRKYLEETPHGKAAAAAREHIAELEKQQAATRKEVERAPAAQPAPTPAPEPSPPPPAEPVRTAEPTPPTPTPAPPAAPATAPKPSTPTPAPVVPLAPAAPPPEAKDGGGLRTAGLVVGGVGVAGIAAGIYFGIQAKNLSDQVSGTFNPADDDSGKAANRNMFISYGVGAAGIITGGVLYYLGSRHRSEAVPMVSVGQDQIHLTWVY